MIRIGDRFENDEGVFEVTDVSYLDQQLEAVNIDPKSVVTSVLWLGNIDERSEQVRWLDV